MKYLTFLIIEVVQFPSFDSMVGKGAHERYNSIGTQSSQPKKPCALLFLYEDKTQKSLFNFICPI